MATALLAGCDSELVLSGNFEQWPDASLVGELPGDPAGDTVWQYPLETPGGWDWYPLFVGDNDAAAFVDAACPVGQPCGGQVLHRMASLTSAELDPDQRTNPFTWAFGGDAMIQPGGDVRVAITAGHYNGEVARLRFHRPTAADPTTVTVEHGGGSQVLETLEFGDAYGYAFYADPDTGTFDIIGGPGASDLPVINPPTSKRRGVFMWFQNDIATASVLSFDGVELFAEN